MEVHADDSHKQVHAENAAHHDIEHEHVLHVRVVVRDRPRIRARPVDVREHIVRPPLQS